MLRSYDNMTVKAPKSEAEGFHALPTHLQANVAQYVKNASTKDFVQLYSASRECRLACGGLVDCLTLQLGSKEDADVQAAASATFTGITAAWQVDPHHMLNMHVVGPAHEEQHGNTTAAADESAPVAAASRQLTTLFSLSSERAPNLCQSVNTLFLQVSGSRERAASFSPACMT